MKLSFSRYQTIIIGIVVMALGLFFLPQLILINIMAPRIVDNLDTLPGVTYGIVFGALVDENGELSDAAKERVRAANLLYDFRVQKLFISGDQSHNSEVDTMAAYAVTLGHTAVSGIAADDIVKDYYGLSTGDTCSNFSVLSDTTPILITQSFHLPRALYICQQEGVEALGIAVDALGLLESRGDSAAQVYAVRAGRFIRESALTWSYMLGLYAMLSR